MSERPTEHESQVPRPGDLVRAEWANHGRTIVEGILDLVLRPGERSASVTVDDGRYYPRVRPSTIVVLKRGAGRVRRLKAGEKRFRDLDALLESEAAPIEHDYESPGYWDDLVGIADDRAEPLLGAGWRVLDQDSQGGWEYGDSLTYILRRGDQWIEVECYEDGDVGAWSHDGDPALCELDADDDREPTPVLFFLRDPTIEVLTAEYRRHGWLP